MKRLMIMSVVFLTACSRPEPEIIVKTEYVYPDIPPALLRPVKVSCKPGETSKALGECALKYKAGINQGNSQIGAIAEIVASHESSPQ